MTGADVRALQKLLGAPSTGFFGPATEAALLKFQASHGLAQTGRADAATKRALARRTRVPAAAPVAPAAGTQGAAQPGAGTSPGPGSQRGPTPGGAAPPPPGSPSGGAATP
jgi:peptidoglycan hydrolase-like protein with peptidoglycan-binding domain